MLLGPAVKGNITHFWAETVGLKMSCRQMCCRNDGKRLLVGAQDLQAAATTVQ